MIHAWDLATATGPDQAMPEGLAHVAHDDAPPQEKLLAFSGRRPGL